MVKNLPANAGDMGSIPGFVVWEDALEKEMATNSSMPGKSHGQRSLMGYSPWSHKELDTTQRLDIFFPSFVEIYLTNKIVLI